MQSGECKAGFGGLIMPEHVKKLFEENGLDMLKFQYQQVQQEQRHQLPPLHFAQRVDTASILPPSSGIIPTPPMRLLPLHLQPTAELPPPKKTKEERPVHVFKGMSAGMIKDLYKQDIIEVLRYLNKPSSTKSKGDLEAVLARALEEKEGEFDYEFTYLRSVNK
jgi:hypothetical protein